MRYRLEFDGGDLVVRNVEADVPVGAVHRRGGPDPHDPNRYVFKGCTVLNHDGEEVAVLHAKDWEDNALPRANTVPDPLKLAAVAIANDEHGSGFAGLKDAPRNPNAHRVECQLGQTMADIIAEYQRALTEHANGGLTEETKRNIGKLVARMYDILWVSRFGSFDAERSVHEPYFANTPPSDPRMAFAAAAQHYGLLEMQLRYPGVGDATLKQALSLPLEATNFRTTPSA